MQQRLARAAQAGQQRRYSGAVVAAGSVDHAVGLRGFARQQGGVIERALHGHDAALGQLCGLCRIADQAAHAMSCGNEVSSDRAADKAGRAGEEDTHERTPGRGLECSVISSLVML